MHSTNSLSVSQSLLKEQAAELMMKVSQSAWTKVCVLCLRRDVGKDGNKLNLHSAARVIGSSSKNQWKHGAYFLSVPYAVGHKYYKQCCWLDDIIQKKIISISDRSALRFTT